MKKNKKINIGTLFIYHGIYFVFALIALISSLVMWFVYLQNITIDSLHDFAIIWPYALEFFMFIVCLYMIVQIYIDHIKQRKKNQIHREYMQSTNDQRYQEYLEGDRKSFFKR